MKARSIPGSHPAQNLCLASISLRKNGSSAKGKGKSDAQGGSGKFLHMRGTKSREWRYRCRLSPERCVLRAQMSGQNRGHSAVLPRSFPISQLWRLTCGTHGEGQLRIWTRNPEGTACVTIGARIHKSLFLGPESAHPSDRSTARSEPPIASAIKRGPDGPLLKSVI